MKDSTNNEPQIYDGPLFKVNKLLLLIGGIWPYAGISKYIMRIIMESILIGTSIPQLLAAIIYYKDIDRLMLSLLAYFTVVTMVLKLGGMILAESEMKNLFDQLANNWVSITDPEEKEVLMKYTRRGKIVIIIYTIAICTMATFISLLPLTPKILDFLFPLENGMKRSPIYLMDGEYFVVREEHFFPIFFADAMATIGTGGVTIVCDSCYIAVVQQSCALYSIVSHRLKLLRPMGSDISSDAAEQMTSYDWLVSTVKLHRIALEFTETINVAYSMSFLFIFMVNIVLVPLDACAILASLGNPVKLIPYLLLFITLMFHLAMICFVGQLIVNHVDTVYDVACYNEWYSLPARTKRLLTIFMLRASDPTVLTAGGLMLINYQSYVAIMKTAMSYIAVLSSFR